MNSVKTESIASKFYFWTLCCKFYILRNGTMMRFQITCKMIIIAELGAELYEKQVLASDVCRAALARLACCGA